MQEFGSPSIFLSFIHPLLRTRQLLQELHFHYLYSGIIMPFGEGSL